MSAPVLDLAARREAVRREAYGIRPEDTAMPIGYLVSRLLDQTRLRSAAARNSETSR